MSVLSGPAIGLHVWGQPLFPRDLQFSTCSVFQLGQGKQPTQSCSNEDTGWVLVISDLTSQTYLPWYYFNFWIPCDSLTAAIVLNSSFLNMFGYNGLSRAKSLIDVSLVNRHSVLQCVCVRVGNVNVTLPLFVWFLLPYHKSRGPQTCHWSCGHRRHSVAGVKT